MDIFFSYPNFADIFYYGNCHVVFIICTKTKDYFFNIFYKFMSQGLLHRVTPENKIKEQSKNIKTYNIHNLTIERELLSLDDI